jgi:hypothetical protein
MSAKQHKSMSKETRPLPLNSKQQEMQRQHNLLKQKFAKYQMMKPKF